MKNSIEIENHQAIMLDVVLGKTHFSHTLPACLPPVSIYFFLSTRDFKHKKRVPISMFSDKKFTQLVAFAQHNNEYVTQAMISRSCCQCLCLPVWTKVKWSKYKYKYLQSKKILK